jgi:hypothetical protein
MTESDKTIVRTSDPEWLRRLALLYKARLAGVLVDDAELGIRPEDQTLLQMARSSGLAKREILGVCVALGLSGVGVTMVILAFSAIRILTNHKPPNIRATTRGIEISWM